MNQFHKNKESFRIMQEAVKSLNKLGGEWVVFCYEKNAVSLISLDNLFNIVSVVSGIPGIRIKGKSRQREICNARHCFAHVAVELGIVKNKCAEMAEYMNVDHTTILHRLKAASDMLETGCILFTELVNECTEMAINQSNVPAISNLIRCEQPSI